MGCYPENIILNIFPEVILLRDLSARDRLLMKDGQAESASLRPQQTERCGMKEGDDINLAKHLIFLLE